MLHRSDRYAALIDVLPCRLVADQLLVRNRVLSVGQARELLPLHFTVQAPLIGEHTVPLAAYCAVLRVIICLPVGEFLSVVGLSLRCTQWFRNSQHWITRRMVLGQRRCPLAFQARSPAPTVGPAGSPAFRYRLPVPASLSRGQ